MKKEPNIGECIVVPKMVSCGWGASYLIHEVKKVVGITPKRREIKLSDGHVLKLNYLGEYECLEATDESIKMAKESIEKDKSARKLNNELIDINQYVGAKIIFNKLSIDEIENIRKALAPINQIVSEMKAR